MTGDLIKRINKLAKKSKSEGLSDEEKREQQALRAQYIQEFRQGVKNTLNNVYIVNEKGEEEKLRRKDKNFGD